MLKTKTYLFTIPVFNILSDILLGGHGLPPNVFELIPDMTGTHNRSLQNNHEIPIRLNG